MSQDGDISERRRFYRIVYPVRLIQLLIKLLNTRIEIERKKQMPGFEDLIDARMAMFLPTFHYGDYEFPVLDISEGGFKLQWRSSSEPVPMMSKRILGKLVFNPDLKHVVDFFPSDMKEVAQELMPLAFKGATEHPVEARIIRKIENKRDPYPQLSLQFKSDCHLKTQFIRNQEAMLIKLFREQYMDRVRVRRQQFKSIGGK